jgi:hypothetical protein
LEGSFEIGGGVTFTGVCSLEMVHHERSGSASVYRWLAGEEDPRVPFKTKKGPEGYPDT